MENRAKGFGIFWFIMFMAVIWCIWYFGGGPQRYQDYEGPYLKPPAPIDTGETYGPPL